MTVPAGAGQKQLDTAILVQIEDDLLKGPDRFRRHAIFYLLQDGYSDDVAASAHCLGEPEALWWCGRLTKPVAI